MAPSMTRVLSPEPISTIRLGFKCRIMASRTRASIEVTHPSWLRIGGGGGDEKGSSVSLCLWGINNLQGNDRKANARPESLHARPIQRDRSFGRQCCIPRSVLAAATRIHNGIFIAVRLPPQGVHLSARRCCWHRDNRRWFLARRTDALAFLDFDWCREWWR